MPQITVDTALLKSFGEAWRTNGGALGRTPPYSSLDLGRTFDRAVAEALAVMLGGIPIITPGSDDLIPVHARFPYAVVAFMVVVPTPCLAGATRAAMIGTLERLGRRTELDGPHHMAEAIALLLWDPETGTPDASIPDADSPLRIERFSTQIEAAYLSRYKGLPPHAE
jgi:hypothetical protein